ncbi:MAG: SDR family NAD(P)-dependent oxidoreductase [Actinomycetota bacterium]|nr:SDR family NAD(P)-dependent oxidoreductase [Actinomycetota bacterium]
MTFDFSDSVAVVTGAGSGIGRSSARAFARLGARVVVTDLEEERAREVADEIGDAAIHLRCDVTRIEDLQAVRATAFERFGRVDLVHNNVGVLAVGPAEMIPMEAWDRVVNINLMGVVRSLTVFLPGLLEQGRGHIVNTASTAGLFPYGYDRLPYTTTKHAIVGLSESLAVYLRPKGIGVSCFCPAGVMTNIAEQITFYGSRQQAPRAPNFGVIDAETAGELVAQGVANGTFLILTTHEPLDELRERGNDIEAYLNRLVAAAE